MLPLILRTWGWGSRNSGDKRPQLSRNKPYKFRSVPCVCQMLSFSSDPGGCSPHVNPNSFPSKDGRKSLKASPLHFGLSVCISFCLRGSSSLCSLSPVHSALSINGHTGTSDQDCTHLAPLLYIPMATGSILWGMCHFGDGCFSDVCFPEYSKTFCRDKYPCLSWVPVPSFEILHKYLTIWLANICRDICFQIKNCTEPEKNLTYWEHMIHLSLFFPTMKKKTGQEITEKYEWHPQLHGSNWKPHQGTKLVFVPSV